MTMIAGGQIYAGWTDIEFGRGMDRCVSNFDISVTEGWPDSPRPILPFTPLVLKIGNDVVLTGYVDDYNPELTKGGHGVRIAGRSKTMDLVDCSPNVKGGQYSGFTVAAVARALCGIFGLQAVVETDLANVVVPDATIEPCESAFEFLDRLCTVAGVIATDDANGNLVLTTAGSTKSNTVLLQGVNILSVSATISGAEQYSEYVVKGQAGLSAGLGASGGTTPGATAVQTGQVATVTDTSVPRYRPKVFMAENATGQAPLNVQAQWHCNYAIGKSRRAEVTVPGWRQNDGTLWAINQMVTLTAPYIGADDDLLAFDVRYRLSRDSGRTTVLTLTPVQAAQPNPRALRQKKGRKGRRGSGIDWTGGGGA